MFKSLFSSSLIGQLSRDSVYTQRQLFPLINPVTLALLNNEIVGIFLSTLLVIPNALTWALLHSWRSPAHIIKGLWLHLIKIPSIVAYEWFSLIQPPFDLIRQHTGKFLLLAASSIMLAFFVPVLPILIRIIALNYGINTALLPVFDRLFPNNAHLSVALASIPNGAALLTQLKKSFYTTMPMASYLPLIALPSTIILSYGYLSSRQIVPHTKITNPEGPDIEQISNLITADPSLDAALTDQNLLCPILCDVAREPVKLKIDNDRIFERDELARAIRTLGKHPLNNTALETPHNKHYTTLTDRDINLYMITSVDKKQYKNLVLKTITEQQTSVINGI